MNRYRRWTAFGAVLLLGACGTEAGEETMRESESPAESRPAIPVIQATNAFYYYEDVDRAWDFYTRVLGFHTVADYGFAKILRLAESSFLTLVDAQRGMHSAEEPKTVTLALVTEEVEGWWAYLTAQNVEMRAEFNYREGQPHDGFVAIDPEGYLLEFERFNRHPENERLTPRLDALEAIYPDGRQTAPGTESQRPADLGVEATVFWLYYEDLDVVQDFYRDALGTELLVDQGWAKVYPVSSSGYLGFVDGARGLHEASAEKAVTLSFFTDDIEAWFQRLSAWGGMEFREAAISEEGEFVRTFVGYDPEGYYLEWDAFLDVEVNRHLLHLLGGKPQPE
jgi:predicted enzyme related to lactoylglutathione lyase